MLKSLCHELQSKKEILFRYVTEHKDDNGEIVMEGLY